MPANDAPCLEPILRRFRVRSDVTVDAYSYADAQTRAAAASEQWSNETGFEHLHGFGKPRGSVVVEEALGLHAAEDAPSLDEVDGLSDEQMTRSV